MVLSSIEAQAKLDKFAANSSTYQFALSPSGFLLINRGKVFEVADFKLFFGGKFYRRNGFTFSTNMTIPDKGLYLCSFCNGKLIAKCPEDSFEFASPKKPLSEDFSLMISMRFGGKIVLFLADGKFDNEAFFITLADTPGNNTFASAMVRNLVGAHNQTAADALLYEEDDNGKEE